jgi:hypothetical protein
MSLGDRASPYYEHMQNKNKINICLWNTLNDSDRDFPRCDVCLERWRLEIITSSDGKKQGKCIRGCGKVFDLEKVVNTETGNDMLVPQTYTNRYGVPPGKQHSFLISQKDKRKSTGLSKEDQKDLALLGSSGGEGVTKVSEEYH